MSARSATIADLGESALIERIERRVGPGASRPWLRGIGDDAAILRPPRGNDLVFSTDALYENVHFRRGRESARVIGRRALAVNLSDLAAMGARPVGAMLSWAGPASTPLGDFDGMIEGFVAEGRTHACPLIGGNLSRADVCSLNVTVIGRVRTGGALQRGGLRAGDELFVTGALGAATLARLRADRSGSPLRRVPVARLAAGWALARRRDTVACIDVSDGLATDLGHLLADSGLGATIEPEALPRPRQFAAGCAELNLDPLSLLSTGGEDYELLFALRPKRARPTSTRSGERGGPPRKQEGVLTRALGLRVSWIGRVEAEPGIRGLPLPAPHHF